MKTPNQINPIEIAQSSSTATSITEQSIRTAQLAGWAAAEDPRLLEAVTGCCSGMPPVICGFAPMPKLAPGFGVCVAPGAATWSGVWFEAGGRPDPGAVPLTKAVVETCGGAVGASVPGSSKGRVDAIVEVVAFTGTVGDGDCVGSGINNVVFLDASTGCPVTRSRYQFSGGSLRHSPSVTSW
jgi:hypothetical protein